MKTRAEDGAIAISPSLLAEIQAAADEEKRPAEEVLCEAIERYLENRRWQRIFDYSQQRARELGITEADLPRLIAESRRERAHERSK